LRGGCDAYPSACAASVVAMTRVKGARKQLHRRPSMSTHFLAVYVLFVTVYQKSFATSLLPNNPYSPPHSRSRSRSHRPAIMRFSLFAPLAFALAAVAAPTSDCESLKSLSILKGAQIFCADKFPVAGAVAQVADAPKSNAKRFKQDDERVVRILGGMPESRQKVFCACYPAAATTSVSASVSAPGVRLVFRLCELMC
jgi:hypothetical protein